MINEREARIVSVIIETADIDEIVAVQMFLRETAYLHNPFRVAYVYGKFAAELGRFGDQLSKLRFKFPGEFKRSHKSSVPFAPNQATSLRLSIDGSLAILS
jgi:hypothetical protein